MRILFLCTGNSCRSQMAEGFARALAAEGVEVFSAGTDPVGVNPRAVRVMAEAGVPIDLQTSKGLDGVPAEATLVVTLCGNAAESCPAFPGGTEIEHWPLPDPAEATGDEDEVLAQFRAVRDEARDRVRRLLEARGVLAERGPASEPTYGDVGA